MHRCPGAMSGLLLKLFYLLKNFCMYVKCKRKPHVCRWPEEGIGCPGAAPPGACHLYCVGAGHEPQTPARAVCAFSLSGSPPFQTLLSLPLSTSFLPHSGQGISSELLKWQNCVPFPRDRGCDFKLFCSHIIFMASMSRTML